MPRSATYEDWLVVFMVTVFTIGLLLGYRCGKWCNKRKARRIQSTSTFSCKFYTTSAKNTKVHFVRTCNGLGSAKSIHSRPHVCSVCRPYPLSQILKTNRWRHTAEYYGKCPLTQLEDVLHVHYCICDKSQRLNVESAEAAH